jgi:hypothetical protein
MMNQAIIQNQSEQNNMTQQHSPQQNQVNFNQPINEGNSNGGRGQSDSGQRYDRRGGGPQQNGDWNNRNRQP